MDRFVTPGPALEFSPALGAEVLELRGDWGIWRSFAKPDLVINSECVFGKVNACSHVGIVLSAAQVLNGLTRRLSGLGASVGRSPLNLVLSNH